MNKVFIVFFLWTLSFLHAQTNDPAQELLDELVPEGFKILAVYYDIQGVTGVRPLERFFDWDYKNLFSTQNEIIEYLEEKKRLIQNNRIFQESDLEYFWEVDQNKIAQVTITVRVKDTWNILALPIPKYSDSEGLNLSLRIRDNNFLGTMEQLRVNLEFKRSTGGTNSLGGSMEIRLPLELGSDDWFLNIEGSGFYKTGNLIDLSAGWSFTYPFLVDKQSFQYGLGQRVSIADSKNTELTFFTFLTTTVKLGNSDLNITPSQSIKILTDYADPDGYFTTSRLDVNLFTPILLLPRDWNVVWRSGSYVYNQYLFEKAISFSRSGVYWGLIQGISAGRWDWVENFRRGLVLGSSYTFEYNFGQIRFDNRVDASLVLHQTAFDLFGISARILGVYHQHTEDVAKMEPVRGVIDSSIQGNYGLFGNLDLTLKIIRVNNFQDWWGWSWMRFFNFEMHFNAFTDWGYIFPIKNLIWDDQRWVWTAGLEIIGFPLAARSYFLRLSYGINLRTLAGNDYNILSGNVRELFIGLGHHY